MNCKKEKYKCTEKSHVVRFQKKTENYEENYKTGKQFYPEAGKQAKKLEAEIISTKGKQDLNL